MVTIEAEAAVSSWTGQAVAFPTVTDPREAGAMKHRKHLFTLWRRTDRRRQEALAEAQRRDAAEAQAAIARMLTEPTAGLPVIAPRVAPLLTPGQAFRSRRPR